MTSQTLKAAVRTLHLTAIIQCSSSNCKTAATRQHLAECKPRIVPFPERITVR